ncbi:uncharacterized protein LOC141892448 isoform X3 [Acropora palmata]
MPSNDEELKKRGEYTFELRRKSKTGQIFVARNEAVLAWARLHRDVDKGGVHRPRKMKPLNPSCGGCVKPTTPCKCEL